MRVRVSVWLVAVAMGLGSLAAGGPAGAAKKSPRLYVKPAKGLHNNQVVKVRGVHFKAHDSVYIVECLVKAAGANGCDISSATPVTVNAKGKFHWTKFTVHTGKIGSGTCGTTKLNLKKCDVSAGNASGQDSAIKRIKFTLKSKT